VGVVNRYVAARYARGVVERQAGVVVEGPRQAGRQVCAVEAENAGSAQVVHPGRCRQANEARWLAVQKIGPRGRQQWRRWCAVRMQQQRQAGVAKRAAGVQSEPMAGR